MLDDYLGGTLALQVKAEAQSELRDDLADLQPEETAVLGLLIGRLEREERRAA